MAYINKKINIFNKGIIDSVSDEVIPNSASSKSVNFLDVGDKLELVRGALLLGSDGDWVNKKTLGMVSAKKLDGTEILFKKWGTYLQYWDTATTAWVDIKTDFTDGDEMSFSPYISPAGSFIWMSSPIDGMWRINLSDPGNITDFNDSAKNQKGFMTIQKNRAFMWGVLGTESTLYLSWIDNDYPYTAIASEAYGTGDNVEVTFAHTVANPLVCAKTVSITDTVETFTDNGSGVLTGDQGGTGTINYTTGACSVTFNTAPANLQAITMGYDYEQPKSEGIADFNYSPTRVAGEGDFLFQGDEGGKIKKVETYDGKYYSLKEDNIWRLDLTVDDTNADNNVYRVNTGVSNWKASVATGDGIYYLDDKDDANKTVKILRYDKYGAKVEPQIISDNIDLNNYIFDETIAYKFGDYIIFACKSSSAVSYNDIMVLYNTKYELWNIMDGIYENFAVYGEALYGGSSVDNQVYQLFSGFDDDGNYIAGNWEAKDWELDTLERKKCKKFIVEGEMAESQTLIVEINYDENGWVPVGTVTGNGSFVESGAGTEYGMVMYGSGTVGTESTTTVRRYMKEFRLGSDKFFRVKVRFRTESIGYLNVKEYTFKDVRLNGYKLPNKFR